MFAKKLHGIVFAALLLTSMLTLAFDIQPANASISSFEWIAPTYYGYDAFFGTIAVGFRSGSVCASFERTHAVMSQTHGVLNLDQEMQRYIVGFIGLPSPDIISGVGGSINHVFTLIRAIAANLTSTMVDVLRSMTSVIEYVEEDLTISVCAETLPWGVDRIDAEKVHPYNKGNGVNIAVLDTGIDTDHEDLVSNYMGGIDIVNDDSVPEDDVGHGTHVCGTIAAVANGNGVIGVAPKANLYAVKVAASNGAYWSWVIEGIEWAVDHNMKIINISLGGVDFSHALGDACQEAYDGGVLLVAAAGNNGAGVMAPARYLSVIAVSATDQNDNIWALSSRGIEVELSAPGDDIYSTMPDNTYGYMDGTSMACPHVTGTAALVWFANPSMTNVEVRQRLQSAAEDLGVPGKDPLYGYGLVDAEKSVYYSSGVGGFYVAADKFGLLFPYICLASTILVAAVATAIYAKRAKHRREHQ